MSTLPPPYKHQQATAEFLLAHPRAFVTSDPGTGKTRSVLMAFAALKAQKRARRMLVMAPLSILRPSWADDCAKWTPELTCAIAYSGDRFTPFESGADVVVINHDGVKWLRDNTKVLADFDVLVIDEFTAFKHATSDRSKALRSIRTTFPYRWLLSGTPNSNSILDIWFPALICDDGERLGKVFSQFRAQVCHGYPIPGVAYGMKWEQKDGAEDMVAARLKDITIRFAAEDCLDLPPNHTYTLTTRLKPRHRKLYDTMLRDAVLELDDPDNPVTAIHAGALVQKLLQICSGAVYHSDGSVKRLNDDRYELIGELCEARDHVLVAFNWRHQREALEKELTKRKLSYAVIDGSTKEADRTQAVADFQAGRLRVILAHPQSAGHGLTLTRGCATIWASPTYNAEWFEQFNHRIHRATQTRETETILIAAEGTIETEVYEKLDNKRVRMEHLLSIFKTLTDIRKSA